MYLSDRDIKWAITRKLLMIESRDDHEPKIDPTSIDLRLDRVEEAKVWDIAKLKKQSTTTGHSDPEVHLGKFRYDEFASNYLMKPPTYEHDDVEAKVCLRGKEVLVRPGGFLLWQTKESVGTPAMNPFYICFIDGKSTRARTGLLVHLTAPTVHSGWRGNVTLEIANVGPFTFVLTEDDVIAQLTVARITSPPEKTHMESGSKTMGQQDVGAKKKSKH